MEFTEPTPASSLQPTLASERLVTLDVLRGIALFGVLAANIWLWFSGTSFLFPGVAQELRQLSADSVAFIFVSTFISGKAIRTFSFLFGLGFALQMIRADAHGRPIVPVYRRRLLVLLAFGAVHAFIFWYGDILLTYAVLGFGLLLFRRRAQPTVLISAALCIFAIPLAAASIPLVMNLLGSTAPAGAGDGAGAAERNTALLAMFASGDPAQIIRGNVIMWRRINLSPTAVMYVNLFGFFLLGLWAGRARVFERAMEYRRQLRVLAAVGIPLGIAFALGEGMLRMTFGDRAATLPWFPLALTAVSVLGSTPFALGYIATATLLLDRPRWKPWLGLFAPVGRMALTNYLSQTLICIAIYYYGGLFGSFHPALGLLLACSIFELQMAFSRWWLSRYRFGPMEWLWRSLTYGQRQPFRLPHLEPMRQPC